MTENQPSRIKNLTITGILALNGCVTIVVVIVALLIGLWLDSLMGQRGPAMIIMLVLSVPLSLFLMIRIALTLVRQIEPARVESVEKEA